ncbi:hypothetical protein [Mesorhizobium sp. ES1-1]|uniref:hypothetical protein n=1 Tax=Mesorhizobium sp. ES1-1 TaxID=2876629 RepID=UPI001CCCBCCB|nr:hypothetical protein [Mesorhizobium sp. ES1-1]MBZ9678912.1 hypothetical protein [Mesorhizobium sp. ES1-1]
MTEFRSTLQSVISELFFRDHARPVEWINLLTLSAWLQFLITRAADFAGPRYPAFAALSPTVWALVIAAIVAAQLVAMWPTAKSSFIRFGAMTMAAGMWTVIAISFWVQADTAPISARTNTVLAIAAAVSSIYLGVGAGRRR